MVERAGKLREKNNWTQPNASAMTVIGAFQATQAHNRCPQNLWLSRCGLGLRFLVILWLTAFPHVTWAGPPFLTDDPQTVEFQHWELYVASMDFKTAGGWVGDGPHVEINYGAVPNVQLHLIAPVAYDSPSVGSGHYGYGDTELGIKFRFIQETRSVPMVGIFPLLEVPTGSTRDGFGTGHVHALLPVWLQKTWGPWTAYGGGGYGINPGAGLQNYGFVGGVLQNQVAKPVLIGVEVYHQTASEVGGRDDTAFNVGTVIDLSEAHHLLFSAGRFSEANRGTLLLDEIGDMTLPKQAKILRVLQDRIVTLVGASAPVPVDVRIVAATHRDLIAMVRDDGFREDLFYRLNVVCISLPQLRERGADYLVLAEHFLRQRANHPNGCPRRCLPIPGPATCASCATRCSTRPSQCVGP